MTYAMCPDEAEARLVAQSVIELSAHARAVARAVDLADPYTKPEFVRLYRLAHDELAARRGHLAELIFRLHRDGHAAVATGIWCAMTKVIEAVAISAECNRDGEDAHHARDFQEMPGLDPRNGYPLPGEN